MPADETTSEPLKTSYTWDLASDHIEWQADASAVLGLPDLNTIATGEAFAARIVAEHQPVWRAAVLGARATANAPQGISYRIQFAFQPDSDAPLVWLSDQGRWWPGPDGRPSRAQGVLHRVDARYLENRHFLSFAPGDETREALNRTRLFEAIAARLNQASRNGQSGCGLLMVAVDNLNAINRSLGPDVGDDLVEAVGRVLRESLSESDTLLRYASNTFAVVSNTREPHALTSLAERLIADVERTEIALSSGPMKASIAAGGIALSGQADAIADAVSRARSALEEAKEILGPHLVIPVGPASSKRHQPKGSLSGEIVSALKENRFLIALQPIVETATRKPVHYEALLRLKQTDGTLIPASDFVEDAENLGLARDMDRRALELALALLSRRDSLKLCLNVSSLTAGDRNWIATLESFASRDPSIAPRLTVEITETSLIHDLDGVRTFVDLLHRIGCRIAIDDFGTGYTSFRHLKTLPIDMLKIDGAFMKDLPNDRHGSVIVSSMIEMARGLGIETVAEWVADEKTAEFLAAAGATYLQGYLYANPVPAEDLEHAGIL